MIEIDGSLGEGGGQVLRSALALSVISHQPLRIDNIRRRRSKPGLRAQHLKAVDAAAAISRARVEGAWLDSTCLTFLPGEIRTGRYKFDIGTAGSTCLVLQTIFLPLSLAGSASTVIITGGTHVPWAPCYHYLDMQWLPYMRRMGFDADIALDSAGFYPQGGGRISATIRPAAGIRPFRLEKRGALRSIQGISAVANLDRSIADRQKRQALRRMQPLFPAAHIKIIEMASHNKGTLLLLQATFEGEQDDPSPQGCYFSLGELGKPAERVADEAADELETYLESDGAVDHHLADQLLLPLAYASGPSVFSTARVSQHLLTNAAVIRAFGSAEVEISGEIGQPGTIHVLPSLPLNNHSSTNSRSNLTSPS